MSPPTVTAVRAGASPFIAFVDLHFPGTGATTSVHYSIEPKPGTVSRPVDVSYAAAYLQRRGYVVASSSTITVPVFGLYSNYANQVDVDVRTAGRLTQQLRVEVDTAAYTDPNGIYDRPVTMKARVAGDSLGFDYFYMKSGLGSPVVVDTDGQIRWVVPTALPSLSSLFVENHFVIGDSTPVQVRRLELDGTSSVTGLGAVDVTDFNHNVDPGKVGLLADVDTALNGVTNYESTVVEFDPHNGSVLSQWDLGDILSRYMRSHGDDPASFVRPGADWFHLNAATYDPSDDSVIVSSRENFIAKIDYDSGDLIWILGDPTKYWHTFPSLAARSLTLAAGGLYPIGQHAVSITHDGLVQVFNDGLGSVNQPAGAPTGESRNYSAVSAYSTDEGHLAAAEVRRFDDGQSIFSSICSSAYEAPAGASVLISYAVADNFTRARLIGLDASQNVAFDFQYAASGCNTSWNAQPIPFESMQFTQ
ncbi:aryl-sulfate sulfotransferase [Variovorax sp. YR216]|uniref:aryl-sulfate sulfotransferase n=1 Tax=Variovorax sp. YR216 TaxID=1882828 RepID=UPI000895F473|nr:aryl-sulfate sulfotransferase [Variovorax sp. YR216]SEA41939.1 Arylsulfotransferase (ASST) [Variovorax sp. YR216]